MASPLDAFLDAGIAWNIMEFHLHFQEQHACAKKNNSGWMFLILGQASLLDYLNLFDILNQ
jgi:hypothetical protein